MDLVRSYKESKYLIFEFDNQSTVKYDLGTNEYIGKKGNPVQNLCSQLRGLSIQDVIDKFDDEKYRKFLQMVYECEGNYFSNVGTFLSKIKKHAKLEQYAICDIKVEYKISFKLNDVPKGLLKLLKEKDVMLTNDLVNKYNRNLSIFTNLFHKEFDMFDTFKMIEGRYGYYSCFENICELVEKYNYNLHSLCEYINNITAYEGYEPNNMLNELVDYNSMLKFMTQVGGLKYDKYPRYLSSQHMITIRNYNRYKQVYSEEIFATRVDVSLEFSYKDYVIIYPKTTSDVKNEGVNLSHCVGSYVDKIIAGTTNVLFLRKKDEPTKSLVTIEVKNGSIIQRRGLYNRNTTEEENLILQKYKEKVLDKLLDKVS